MTLLIANASCSESKFRIELTVKLKKLKESLVIVGRTITLFIANASCSEMTYRIELTVKHRN